MGKIAPLNVQLFSVKSWPRVKQRKKLINLVLFFLRGKLETWIYGTTWFVCSFYLLCGIWIIGWWRSRSCRDKLLFGIKRKRSNRADSAYWCGQNPGRAGQSSRAYASFVGHFGTLSLVERRFPCGLLFLKATLLKYVWTLLDILGLRAPPQSTRNLLLFAERRGRVDAVTLVFLCRIPRIANKFRQVVWATFLHWSKWCPNLCSLLNEVGKQSLSVCYSPPHLVKGDIDQ